MREILVVTAIVLLMGCAADGGAPNLSGLPDPGPQGSPGWVERITGGVSFGDITILGEDHVLIDVKSYANLFYVFDPVPETWYEVSGEIRLIKTAMMDRMNTGISLGFFGGQPGDRTRDGGSVRVWDRDGVWQEFSFIVYSGSPELTGRLQLMPGAGSIELRGLHIEERADAFVAMLEDLQKDVAGGHQRFAEGPRIIGSVPDSLLARAAKASLRQEFVGILQDQVMAMEEADMVWAQESLNDLGLFASPLVTNRRSLPPLREESLKSTRSPSSLDEVVTSWLADDIAYVEPVGGQIIDAMRQGYYLDAGDLDGARALVIDLRRCREPEWLTITERGRFRVVHALVAPCLADSVRWARRVPAGQDSRVWVSLSPAEDRVEVPVLVIIGPETNGSAALAAELFQRTGAATLIGEPTDLLPACRKRHFVPWKYRNGGGRCLLYPAGVWEAADGTVLTGTRVSPDIEWPAGDTEGLVSRCRRIVRERTRND